MKTIEHFGGSLVVAVLCATPVLAQKTTFNPSLAVGVGYTDNLDYTGEDTEDSDDLSARLGVSLPLRHKLPRGSVNLTYHGDITLYQENGDADNVAHRVFLDYSRTTRRELQFVVRARYVRTEEQLDSRLLPGMIEPDDVLIGPVDDVDLSVTERTTRESGELTINTGWRLAPRWRFGVGLAAGVSNFDGGRDVESRTSYGGGLSLRTNLAPGSFLGLGYRQSWFQFDESGDETIQNVSLTYQQRLLRTLRLEMRLGAFKVETDASEESESGTFGTIRVIFNDGLVAGPFRFGFSAGASPSGGGALVGSSLNTSVGASVSGVRVRPWNWGLYATYNHRNPFDSSLADSNTAVLRASVERSLRRRWGLRFDSSWVNQSSDDPALESSYLRASLSLVAYPLGGTRISGLKT